MHCRATLLSIALSLLASGCGTPTKIKECNDLITVINAGVDKVQKATGATPDGGNAVAEMRALADSMDVIAGEAAAVAVTIDELKTLSSEYHKMITEVAAAARDLATAVDDVDVEHMAKAQRRMAGAVKLEDPLVERLNKFCQQP